MATGVDDIICLGDIISTDRERSDHCVIMLEARNVLCVFGNHDSVLMETAKGAPENNIVSLNTLGYLEHLPLRLERGKLLFTHISPLYDAKQLRSSDNDDARDLMPYLIGSKYKVLFVGHTHQPEIIDSSGSTFIPEVRKPVQLKASAKYIINPGAVDMMKPLQKQTISYGIFDTITGIYTAMDAYGR